jgi:hypothetical protein
MRVADAAIFALWRLAALLGHPRLHWKYLRRMRRIPDVAVPVLFSERMLWRKLFDRNPDFVTFSDKLACKRWIAERLPELPIPRVLWQGERPEDIPPDLVRTGVAIKASHGSGFNLLIRDAPPPREQVVAAARRWLATDWGRRRGEWCYAAVPRRVFVEELIVPAPDDPAGTRLIDIKVHAGGGRIGMGVCLAVSAEGRRGGLVFDPQGRRLSEPGFPLPEIAEADPGPELLGAAYAAARRLSGGVDYARFDFLGCGRRLYAGEVTVFHMAGYRDFGPLARPCMEAAWDLRQSHLLREGAAQGGPLARAYAAALARAIAAGRALPP